MGKFNQSLLAGAFLGMFGPGTGYQKAPSDCSLERYRKPGKLARMAHTILYQLVGFTVPALQN